MFSHLLHVSRRPKLIFTFIFITLVLFSQSFSAQALPGDLDATFGSGGKVTYRFGDREDTFNAVAIQPDGKIVVSGRVGNGQLLVARYTAGGVLDTSFDFDGIYFSPVNNLVSQEIAIQSDGKIVVAGILNSAGSNTDFFVLRLNPNGSSDNTFGLNGVIFTGVTTGGDYARDLVIQPDGKIIVVGTSSYLGFGGGDVALVRYNTDGSLDTGFGSGGKVITSTEESSDQGCAVALMPDGRIVVFAVSIMSNGATNNSILLARYLPDGTLDSTFDGDGISLFSTGSAYFEFGDMALQTDGKIVVTASIGSNSTFSYTFTVARFLTNGAIDANFGSGGTVPVIIGGTNQALSLVIQPDGKIIAGGHTMVAGNGLDIILARLNPDGSFDSAFGNGGKVFTPVATGNRGDYSWDIALQNDGKIVVAGDHNMGTLFDYDALILRYDGGAVIPARTRFDYDGDGKADVSVFRPVGGNWYISNSLNNSLTAVQFGANADLIAPADFDGDNKTDISVFRPTDGGWYRLNSLNNTFSAVQFGTNGDLPAPGDFDGDGKADISVYRPSAGSWYRINSSNQQFVAAQFGIAEDKPIIGDFDGDGKSDLAVFRPSNGTWYRINSSDNAFGGRQFGISEDKPVAADYDGDGKTDLAVYRPSAGDWYLINSANNSFTATHFGVAEDKPAPADYDGDGKADLAVFRPSSGTWYLLRTTAGFTAAQFGASGDVPTPNAFVR